MKQHLAGIIAAAAIALVVAACGGPGSSSSGVATLPSASIDPAVQASESAGPAASDQVAQALDYAQCMRSQGVPGWPDPDGTGAFLKSQIRQAIGELGSPQYQQYLAADTACQDLLPSSMREPTQAQVQQAWADDRSFAQCMRSLGVTNAPDPVGDDHGRPYFDLSGTGIDPSSPQIMAKAQQCQSQLHLSSLPPVSGGGGS